MSTTISTPQYQVIPGKEKVLARLKKLAKDADAIYLAPDPDREGEAIAAHLAEELGDDGSQDRKRAAKRILRVTFNEITKRAVQEAFRHPRDIDRNLVAAQQTRRVLDRLVGYQVSPLLWDKVRRGLSAGRVQTSPCASSSSASARSRLSKEYWTIDAHLQRQAAGVRRPPGRHEPKQKLESATSEEAAQVARAALEDADWTVARSRSASAAATPRRRSPPASSSRTPRASWASASSAP